MDFKISSYEENKKSIRALKSFVEKHWQWKMEEKLIQALDQIDNMTCSENNNNKRILQMMGEIKKRNDNLYKEFTEAIKLKMFMDNAYDDNSVNREYLTNTMYKLTALKIDKIEKIVAKSPNITKKQKVNLFVAIRLLNQSKGENILDDMQNNKTFEEVLKNIFNSEELNLDIIKEMEEIIVYLAKTEQDIGNESYFGHLAEQIKKRQKAYLIEDVSDNGSENKIKEMGEALDTIRESIDNYDKYISE